MSQETVFGTAEGEAFIKVHRAATDTDEFYRVLDPVPDPDTGLPIGAHVLITGAEYEEATR